MQQSSRAEILDRAEKAGYRYEHDYHGCSRCSLRAVQEQLGLPDGAVLRAAAPLAGGIALSGDTCGAILGCLLAVGLATADEDFENTTAFQDALAAGYRCFRRLKEEFGKTTCRELQTERLGRYYDMTDRDQYEDFKNAGGYDKCSEIVARASRVAAEFILEQWERAGREVPR